MTSKQYFSNGKLLITGEYLVLDGALSLAIPTKFGQYLDVIENVSNVINWKSFDADGSCWFEAVLSIENIKARILDNEDIVVSTLIEILHQAFLLNPFIFDNGNGFDVETKLTFPRKWGLGTSSTLINNVAQWFNIDAFDLLNKSFGGSGYDIACAQNNSPILFQIVKGEQVVQRINFEPKFLENLFFVYLNQKQNSNSAIKMYRQKRFDTHAEVAKINDITTQIWSKNLLFSDFCNLINDHESIMSQILQLSPIQNELFSDFDGAIKSLGAWGGDFVLVASKFDPSQYFRERGYNTILAYHEMIL